MNNVGSLVKLKVACLGVPPGTIGYVFHDYETGFQAIFPNGEYSGFGNEEMFEWLDIIGSSSLQYKFTNVMQLSRDFEKGYFDEVFKHK